MPPRRDDARALVPPRSLAELDRLLVKRGGWYAARESVTPHRMIQELLQQVEAQQFPSADLAGAAVAVTRHYLAGAFARPNRYTFELIDRLDSGADREDVLQALRAMMTALRAMGPVAEWGRRVPNEVPSAAERMSALGDTLRRERVRQSLDGFCRFAEAVEASPTGEPTESLGAPPRSRAAEETLAQITRHLWTAGAAAVAYQEAVDRFPLTVGPGVGEEAVLANGRMFVELTRAMTRARERRIMETRDALLHVAGLELPKIPNPSKAFHRVAGRLGTMTGWVMPVAGDAIKMAAESGAEVDAWRVDRALHSPVALAVVMAPAYVNADAAAADVVRPPEYLVPERYPAFYDAVSVARVRSGDYDLRRTVFTPALAEAPMRALRARTTEAVAAAGAERLVRLGALLQPEDDVQAALEAPGGPDADTGQGVTVLAPSAAWTVALSRRFTRPGAEGRQTPMPAAEVQQALHAAAIGIGSLERWSVGCRSTPCGATCVRGDCRGCAAGSTAMPWTARSGTHLTRSAPRHWRWPRRHSTGIWRHGRCETSSAFRVCAPPAGRPRHVLPRASRRSPAGTGERPLACCIPRPTCASAHQTHPSRPPFGGGWPCTPRRRKPGGTAAWSVTTWHAITRGGCAWWAHRAHASCPWPRWSKITWRGSWAARPGAPVRAGCWRCAGWPQSPGRAPTRPSIADRRRNRAMSRARTRRSA